MQKHVHESHGPIRVAARFSAMLPALAMLFTSPDVQAEWRPTPRPTTAPLHAATQRRSDDIQKACTANETNLKTLKGLKHDLAQIADAKDEKNAKAIVERLLKNGVAASELPAVADLDPKNPAAFKAALEKLQNYLIAEQKKTYDNLIQAVTITNTTIPKDDGLGCSKADCAKLLVDRCTAPGGDGIEGAGAGASIVGAGVSWQNAVVSGVTQFLADRTEEELLLWLVGELQSGICNDPEGAYFFPSSCKEIKLHGEGLLGSLFIETIRRDLESLPARVMSRTIALDETMGKVLVDALAAIRDGESPVGLVAGLGIDPVLVAKCPQDATACGLVSLGLLAGQLGDGMANDEKSFEKFLEQNAKLAIFYINKTCAEKKDLCVLRTNISIETDLEYVKAALRVVFKINREVRQWRDQGLTSTTDTSSRAGRIVGLTIDLLDSAMVLVKADAAIQAKWPTIRGGLKATNHLLLAEYAAGIRELTAVIPAGKVPKPILQYGALAVELAEAENATQVKAVLSAAAAPTGSWRGKRGRTMLSLNGVVGVAGGFEWPLNSGNDAREGAASVGAMGALGLDVSFPCGDKSTWGFFFPILDVGQLLSTPITKSTSTDEDLKDPHGGADFKLVQVFSPGAYLRFGLGKTPLLLGGGVAFPPLLREYTDASGAKDLFSMMRLNAFVGVDLTLLPIYRSKQ